MVKYEREGSKLVITIDTSKNHTIISRWESGSELFAKLLLSDLMSKQWHELERIRRESYEEGYNDKKKRMPKKDYFKSGW